MTKKSQYVLSALIAMVVSLEAFATSPGQDVLVYVWEPVNNRVLRIAQFTVDPRSHVIQQVLIYDNLGEDRPEPASFKEYASIVGSITAVATGPGELCYSFDEKHRSGMMTFIPKPHEIRVTSDFAENDVTIRFREDQDGYSAHSAGTIDYVFGVDDVSMAFDLGSQKRIFQFSTGNYRAALLENGPWEAEAKVSNQSPGHYIIEMPPYGDPGEFSHRIEVWTDKPSRGTLRSAAINSYLLPAGTFDFIFPFFAPTPQEVFEQAAAGE